MGLIWDDNIEVEQECGAVGNWMEGVKKEADKGFNKAPQSREK